MSETNKSEQAPTSTPPGEDASGEWTQDGDDWVRRVGGEEIRVENCGERFDYTWYKGDREALVIRGDLTAVLMAVDGVVNADFPEARTRMKELDAAHAALTALGAADGPLVDRVKAAHEDVSRHLRIERSRTATLDALLVSLRKERDGLVARAEAAESCLRDWMSAVESEDIGADARAMERARKLLSQKGAPVENETRFRLNPELHDAIAEVLGTNGDAKALAWLRGAFDRSKKTAHDPSPGAFRSILANVIGADAEEPSTQPPQLPRPHD